MVMQLGVFETGKFVIRVWMHGQMHFSYVLKLSPSVQTDAGEYIIASSNAN